MADSRSIRRAFRLADPTPPGAADAHDDDARGPSREARGVGQTPRSEAKLGKRGDSPSVASAANRAAGTALEPHLSASPLATWPGAPATGSGGPRLASGAARPSPLLACQPVGGVASVALGARLVRRGDFRRSV